VKLDGRDIKALPTRDAMLPILLVLAGAKACGSVSRSHASLPQRFTHSDRLQNFAPDESRALLAKLQASDDAAAAFMAPKSGRLISLDLTDGFRASFENGDIVHLRPSGNAPELRCYAEAATPDAAESLCAACLVAIEASKL
jgi:phosphomannomutase